ncbi:MAG: prepilin-type N-terminal cleavage/methylation domain-containing protein [Candidatus Omnitrophica bacterium]|nr:prepilin-type N-terminal cleavage/methylation domain-containing protein [Candidatus Omnitrophota bacterium]
MTKNEKGLTLLEMMVSLAIFSVVVLLILQIFHIGSKTLEVAATQSKIVAGARKGIDTVNRELRNSSYTRVTVLQSGASLQFTIPQTITSEGSITWSGPIRYSLGGTNNDQLLRQDVNAGTSTVIANKVASLLFTKNANPDTLTIDVTTQGETLYGTDLDPIALRGTVEFRN